MYKGKEKDTFNWKEYMYNNLYKFNKYLVFNIKMHKSKEKTLWI